MTAVRLPVCLALWGFFFSFCAAGQENRETRFDEGWKFAFGHAADPARDFGYGLTSIFSKSGKAEGTAILPDFPDSNWETLQLPHDWAVRLPFQNDSAPEVAAHGYKPVGRRFPATSIGWYRKHFRLNAADSGKRFALRFDGVFRHAEVWINGFYLGTNESGYLGFVDDLTDYVNFSRENVVVVRVDATQYEGWFYEGAGIYRDVWLEQSGPVRVAGNGRFIHAAVSASNAAVTVETRLLNAADAAQPVQLETRITDRDGRPVGPVSTATVVLVPGADTTATQLISFHDPRLWSPETPYLYRIVSVLRCNGRLLDSTVKRYGMRWFGFDGEKGFSLNGRPYKIKGVNNHQDHAGVGSALTGDLYYYRLQRLKDFGVNAYRCSHNAPGPELLDACDSLGLLVLDENRLLNSSPEYMTQLDRLILRDRSHCSVFLWSIGNEEGYVQTNGTGARIAQTLLRRQKQLDPTRTSTYAADLPNVFTGIDSVIPVRGFNYRQFAVADYHRDHPRQPLLGTETGSTVTTRGEYVKDSLKGFLPDEDLNAPWWACLAEQWWPLAATNDYWMGGFVWTGFDYRGEPTPFVWPSTGSSFGFLDACGFDKNLAWYYKSWWVNEDVIHLSPHWNWAGKEGQPIDVWVNSNAEKVELFLNGKSLGVKHMPANSHLQWSVPYHAGTLRATGTRKGKRFSTEVQTTGAAYRLQVTPSRQTIPADGRSLVIYNVSVVDKSGREVPAQNRLLHFLVSGDAVITGVGNGDPTSHEPDYIKEGAWQRKMFNSKCQVIVRSGNRAGAIRFMASTDGGILPAEASISGEMKQ